MLEMISLPALTFFVHTKMTQVREPEREREREKVNVWKAENHGLCVYTLFCD